MLYNKKPGQKRKNKIDRLFEDQKALMQRERILLNHNSSSS